MAKRRISIGGVPGTSTGAGLGVGVGVILPTPTDYTVTTAKSIATSEPAFSFYIPNSEFYINTPSISVSDVSKSRTNFNDGVFYFMNKNNTPIYYKDLVLGSTTISGLGGLSNSSNNSAFIRASFINSSDKLVTVEIDTVNITNDDMFTYIPYNVKYKGNGLGVLSLRILNTFYNNPGITVFPFESVKFAASFIGLNTGNLSKLYYGRTIKSPDKNVGTIDFTYNFEYYVSNPLKTDTTPDVYVLPMVISVNFVNTGYIPSIISLSTTPPSTGGGYTPSITPPVAPSPLPSTI